MFAEADITPPFYSPQLHLALSLTKTIYLDRSFLSLSLSTTSHPSPLQTPKIEIETEISYPSNTMSICRIPYDPLTKAFERSSYVFGIKSKYHFVRATVCDGLREDINLS
jgi:hypothetical protein